jgi:hypothetical protein
MNDQRDSKSFLRTAAALPATAQPVRFRERVLEVAQVALLATVYLGAAKVSLLFAIPPGYATAVWPPSGIALAACCSSASGCGRGSGSARRSPTSA